MWHAGLGRGDGIDVASRGYLKALEAVEYEHVMISPDELINFLEKPELENIRHLFSYPKKFETEVIRVKEGDPRIGGYWGGEKVEEHIPAPAHAPAGSVAMKWDNEIKAGAVDRDFYENHPESLGAKYTPKLDLIVLHYAPVELTRMRDRVAKMSEGILPIVDITAWETSHVAAGVAQQLCDLDTMITPSIFSKKALQGSGIDIPIRVVPHALSIEPLSGEEWQYVVSHGGNKYIFYAIGTNIPRKNLEAVIAAYVKAFAPKYEHVGLIIKTTCGKDQAKSLYERGVELAGVIDHRWPKIPIYRDKWPAQKVRALHYSGNCYVDMSRGEGFGLVTLEAAAMGNPCLVPNYGAQQEILDHSGVMGTLIPSGMCSVDDSMDIYGPYDSRQNWGDPDIDSMAEAMRQAAESRWSKSLAQARIMEEHYGHKAIGKKLEQVLTGAKKCE
jgi:glycosyltransferase involved in cell wall biosynthesis